MRAEFLSVALRLKIDGCVLAAAVYFEFEVQAVAFIQRAHACAFDCADVHECVGLAVVALDEAEALHGVEELDRAAGAFAGQLALRATTIAAAEAATVTAEAACAGFAGFTRTIDHRKGLALDLEVGRRDLAATVHQGEAELLTFGKAGQASLLNGADVDEHVFRAVITDDEAEALLTVEEFDYAGAFANDLRGHAAATAAAEAATTAAAAEAATAAAETTAAAAEAITAAAEAAAITTAETTTISETTAEAATIVTAAVKIVVAKTVALVLAAPAAATSIKTHALLVTFASPRLYRMNMPGEWHEESTADMRV